MNPADSMIASLRARLDAVIDLVNGPEEPYLLAPRIRRALNGYVHTRDVVPCEGLAPFACGNPDCPAHNPPATPHADDRNEES